MFRRWFVLVTASAMVMSCTREDVPVDATPETLAALAKRAEAVHDVRYDGVAKDLDSNQELQFAYASQQPRYLRASTLAGGNEAARYVFDGTHLTAMDVAAKQGQRIDLHADEARLLETIHQVFTHFSVEGWRPPLLRPQLSKATLAKHQGEAVWLVRTPIDDKDIVAVEVMLRPRTADFLGMTYRNGTGAEVRSVVVNQEYKDAATGLSFPAQWTLRGAGQNQQLTLTNIRINQGIEAAFFDTSLPPGYASPEQP
jgi:outer membrane lipoprotein-sorting protein